MSLKLRKYASAFLALILTVSSLQMAIARHALMPVDHMVICSGEGAYTIALDAEGNPTDEVHYCPECIASALTAIEASAPEQAQPAATTLTLEAPAQSLPVPQVAWTCPQARGPPLSV